MLRTLENISITLENNVLNKYLKLKDSYIGPKIYWTTSFKIIFAVANGCKISNNINYKERNVLISVCYISTL